MKIRPQSKGRWYLFLLWQNHLSTPSFEQVASVATISHISTWKKKRREEGKKGGREKGRKASHPHLPRDLEYLLEDLPTHYFKHPYIVSVVTKK